MATQSASGNFNVVTGNSGRVAAAMKNDGGTMVNGGGSTQERLDSAITKHIDVNDIAGAVDYAPGSQVVAKTATGRPNADEATDNPDGITTARAGGGGLAYFPDARAGDRNFILRAAGSTAAGKINNDATIGGLLTGAGREHDGVGFDGVHETNSYRHLGTMTYDILARPSTDRVPGRTITGARGDAVGTATNFVDGTTASGVTASNDNEAARAANVFGIPGELTYRTGASNPVNDDYKRRDVFES